MPGELRGRLLDGFEVSVHGRAIDRSAFERPSGVRLLKLLLAIPGHRIRREEAAELLWPEGDPERSAANLRKAIHFARRALDGDAGEREAAAGDSVIRGEGEWLGLDDAWRLDIDVDRLRSALDALRPGRPGSSLGDGPTEALETLAELGGGDLLPEDPYEEWLVPLRERLRQATLEALARGIAAARTAGGRELAFRLIDRTLALDPADEGAHRSAIQLHLDAGELHAARRQLLACARALAETYGVEPPEDLAAAIEAAAATRPAAAPLAGEPPIIGRRQELEAAEPALDAVSAGRLGVVLFRGAAGIGKTRVLRELERSSAASGWRIIDARGLESSPDVAFGALGGALAAALERRLPAALEEPGRSAILSVAPAFGERPTVTFASDSALLAAMLDGLASLARERPVALMLDDVQWLDRPTIELLDRAVTALRDAPVLLAGTLRDAPDPLPRHVAAFVNDAEAAGAAVTRIGPVAPREIELILAREVPGGRLDPALASAIGERAGGAPLFALEVLRSAREAGLIVERGGSWRLASADTVLPVPPGVGLMVERRTETLPPDVAAILQLAAELGDDVALESLVAAHETAGAGPGGDGASAVLDALDAGMVAGLIVERGGRYGFAHPLFRAALRAGVRPRARADLHLGVAHALARGLDPTDRPGIEAAAALGRDVVGAAAHAIEAAQLGRTAAIPLAVGFGFVAGSRHAALFDHATASEVLRRSIALWDRLASEDAGAFPAFRASLQLGWSRHAMGDEPGAAIAFQSAARVATLDRERAQAHQAEAWMPYQHGRFEAADAILAAARKDISDPVALAGIDADRAWIMGRRGEWTQAYEQLVTSVAVIETANEPALLARSLDRLGVAMRDAVDPDGAVSVLERSQRLATEIGDVRLAAIARMHLAGAYRQTGRLEDASREIEATLAVCGMTGDRYIEAVTVWIAAEVEHARGRYTSAIELRRREIELLRSLGGNEHNQAMAHAHIAWLHAKLGETEPAAREAAIARQVAAHSGLAHLPGQIEDALAAPEWFIEDAGPAGPGTRGEAARRKRVAASGTAGKAG